MAGRQQQNLGFEAAERDARASYAERNNELRSRLRSIEVSLTGLSPLRWKNVFEMLMSVWSHATTTTGEAGKPLEAYLATSGLKRNQFYRAREDAVELGLLAVTQHYHGRQRAPDRLDVNVGAIDTLVEQSRFWRDHKMRLAETRWDQVGLAETSIKEDTARVGPKIPNKPNTTSSYEIPDREARSAKRPERTRDQQPDIDRLIEEVEEVVNGFGFAVTYLADAIREAARSGCSREQILDRIAWFGERLDWWQPEFRPGSLYTGIICAHPRRAVHDGWPHLEKRRLQAEQQRREHERARQQQLDRNLRHEARTAATAAARDREERFGPQLDAFDEAALEALEQIAFRGFSKNLRGRVGYRQCLLTALEERLREATSVPATREPSEGVET